MRPLKLASETWFDSICLEGHEVMLHLPPPRAMMDLYSQAFVYGEKQLGSCDFRCFDNLFPACPETQQSVTLNSSTNVM